MADVQGLVAPGFERVSDVFERSLASGEELGAGFAAIRDGETIVDIWGGYADRLESVVWSRTTLVPVYSTTKAISSFIVARLADQGLLDYEKPVSDLWPSFAQNGKGAVTLAQALSHQAGVPGFAEPINPDLWLDPPACAEAIAALAPMWQPGTASGYHPLTWGYIVGEAVRRASGRSLGSILREDICAPLGIDFYVGLPEGEQARCAEVKKPEQLPDFGPLTQIKRAAFLTRWAAPQRGGSLWRRIELPAANGHGTALSVAQLFGLYATGGEIQGRRVLSPRAFAALTDKRVMGEDLVLPFQLDWRTGVLGNNNLFYGRNRDAFGHSGFGGSCGLGDPAERLSAGYVMSKQSHHLLGDPRALKLIEALYQCLS